MSEPHFNKEVYAFAWAAFSIANGQTPDIDTAINVGLAKSITIQFDTTPSAHVSTSSDLNIITSPDGTNWDTIVYAEAFAAFGDNAVQTIALTPGIGFIKLRCDNNDGVNDAAPEARVVVRR